jgi:hypothetical protein
VCSQAGTLTAICTSGKKLTWVKKENNPIFVVRFVSFLMKHFYLLLLADSLLLSGPVLAQVGINNPTPDNSAVLDLTSSSKGLLIPRMNATQRGNIPSPATGLMVYQTDAPEGFYYYSGSSWTYLSPLGDDLGSHTASQNLGLNGNWLSNDGDAEGLRIDNNGKVSINTTPDPNSNLYVHRPSGIYGPGMSTFLASREGSPVDPADGGISWSFQGSDAAIKGYSNFSNYHTAGVAGYNYNDFIGQMGGGRAGVLGSHFSGSIWGALYYFDGNQQWGLYTPSKAYLGGGLNFPIGAQNGYVLTSDAAGNATWQAPAVSPGTANYVPKWNATGGLTATSLLYDNGASVGVGTTTPAAGNKLEVAGVAHASTGFKTPSTQTYGYTSAKTLVKSINPSVFNSSSNAYDLTAIGIVSYVYIANGTVGSQGWYATNLDLPNGATITGMEATVMDNDATYNMQITINQYPIGSGSGFQVASASTTGSSTAITTISDNTIGAVIDYTQNNYSIAVTSVQSNSNLRLYNVKVTYTVNNAD